MRVIGLCGLSGSGKSTVADLIYNILPNHAPVDRMAFADEVKWVAKRYFSWRLTGDKETDRALIRDIAMSWRAVDQDVWVNALKRRVDSLVEYQSYNQIAEHTLVVSDIRFQNELDYVKSIGGQVWLVYREGVESDMHESERPDLLDGIDLEIDNSYKIHDTEAKVRRLLA